MSRFFICALVLAACGSASHPRLALDDAGIPDAPAPDALATPPLQAALVWPETLMSPGGALDRATPVDTLGTNFPTRVAISLAAPPPDDVLADFASHGLHAIMANVVVLRQGSIDATGHVSQCEEWGHGDDVVIYMTQAGAWLSTEFGYNDPTVYSQGYHLFGVNIIDAGPCNDPMCPGPTSQLYEVPLESEISIELRDPNEWCH